jgi:3-methyladenine DNA glycosylase/8-oxoguanine DNA glycosylase
MSPEGRQTTVTVAGAGASWLLARAPALCGLEDDATTFRPEAGVVRDLWRRYGRTRLTRTHTLWHDLAWLIVQQRVKRDDSAAQWRALVLTHGTTDGSDDPLWYPPSPDHVAQLAYHDLHRLGIERRRAQALINAARHVGRLERRVDQPFRETDAALAAIDGIGPWTRSMLRAVTWGDPDAVVVGDSGIPSMVTWMLAREARGDDARMLELLDAFRPHRYRVVKIAFDAKMRPRRQWPHRPRHDIRDR